MRSEEEFYLTVVSLAKDLDALDPAHDTPLGVLLLDLANAIENYEQMRWPLGRPPEPEK